MGRFVRCSIAAVGWLGALAAGIVVSVPAANSACLTPLGDITGDVKTNVVDVQCQVVLALWSLGGGVADVPSCLNGLDPVLADVNCDDQLTVVDVQLTISYTLGQALDGAIDSNGDGCPDSCQLYVCGDGFCSALNSETCISCPEDCGVCTNDCCVAAPTPGCVDSAWVECVCAVDTFCCDTAWDQLCVTEITALGCGSCAPVTADCCGAGDGPGCNDGSLACQQCVCTIDPLCCEVAWDETCADKAVADCAAGNTLFYAALSGTAEVPPNGSPAKGEAFFTLSEGVLGYVVLYSGLMGPETGAHIHQAPVGTNGSVVFPLPSGPVKSGILSLNAQQQTNLLLGLYYVNIHSAIFPGGEIRGQIQLVAEGACECAPSVGGCCDAAGENPGCGDPQCEACVCDLDAFCCNTAWDDICVGEANVDCPFDCNCPLLADCCLSPGTLPRCDNPGCEACVCTLDDFCCEVAWDAPCVELANQSCPNECGCAVLGCPGKGGSCYEPNGTTGCDEVECCEKVCAVDTFCCEAAWDVVCADEAIALCQTFPTEFCCVLGTNVPGCGNPFCEDCICPNDPFCCDVAWDSTCVDQAQADCSGPCQCGSL